MHIEKDYVIFIYTRISQLFLQVLYFEWFREIFRHKLFNWKYYVYVITRQTQTLLHASKMQEFS